MATYEQALAILEATPGLLRTILAAASSEALDWKPTDEAWSTRAVLDHLLQAEATINYRVHQIIEEDRPTLGVAPATTPPDGTEQTLAAWLDARSQNLAYLRALTPEQIQRTGQHRRYGAISAREQIVEWAYHDLDHLRQILATFESGLYPDIGAFQALYSRPS